MTLYIQRQSLKPQLVRQCMTKMINFRVTEDEFKLFCLLAQEQNRTLSSYMKNLARQDAYRTGARTPSAIAKLNPGSTTTTIATMQSKPAPLPKPVANPKLDALFAEDIQQSPDGTTEPPPDGDDA